MLNCHVLVADPAFLLLAIAGHVLAIHLSCAAADRLLENREPRLYQLPVCLWTMRLNVSGVSSASPPRGAD